MRVMSMSSSLHNAGVILFPKRWRVYCFLSSSSRNVIREWLDQERISVAQRADFQMKINLFESGGPEVVPGFITDTPVSRDIYKAKIKGNKGRVQLRPMLCKGPFAMDEEITFLCGAIERDGVLDPKDCKLRAQERRKTLLAEPDRRRNEGVI